MSKVRSAEQAAPVAKATAHRQGGSPSDSGERATILPDVELTPQLLFQVLASEIAAQRGQVGSATATYRSLARETRDPRLARRATELALSQRALEAAVPAAELWLELEPNSGIAAQTLETLQLSTGRIQAAEPLVVKRLQRARSEGTLEDFYAGLERTLARVSDSAAAHALLERIAEQDGSNSAARLALAGTAVRAKLPDQALSQAQAAVKLAPDNEETVIAAASVIESTAGGRDTATNLLADFVERKPDAIEARFSYARLLANSGRKSEASDQFEAALQQEPDSPSILFSLAQLAYQTDQKPLARGYLERYVDLAETIQRDNNPAYLFLGQIAEEANDIEDAVGFYAKVSQGRQYLDARLRRAALTARLGDVEAGIQMLRQTNVGSARERARLTSAEAGILRDANRLQESFDLLSDAVKRAPENTDLLYDHAMAAERIDKIDVLEKSLRKMIELEPNSAHGYNALGYTLADRNIRLDEARKLIEKALELSPDDPHIIDSLGWVMYRQGDLQGAERELRRAYETSKEAEIGTHLGEVLWQLGKKSEARELWARAMSSDPDNKTLRETLARLNVNL